MANRKKPKVPLLAMNMPSKKDYEEELLSILRNKAHSDYNTPDIVHNELLTAISQEI